jgi:DNA-binding MarR family transcriptional regulator
MKEAEIASLAYEIWSLTHMSAKLLSRGMERKLATCQPGINLWQYGVLRLLENDTFTIRELSQRMLLAPSTLVPIIDKLESDGLVIRGKDPQDRRRTPLELTPAARRILQDFPEDHLRQALEALGPDKSRALSQLLQELIRLLDEDSGRVDCVLSQSTQIENRLSHCHKDGARHNPANEF